MSSAVPTRADLERLAGIARREHARAQLAEREADELRTVLADLVTKHRVPRSRQWVITAAQKAAQNILESLPPEPPDAVTRRRADLLADLSR